MVPILFMLAAPSMSAELFRYRGTVKDGSTLEYVFESHEKTADKSVTKEQSGGDRRQLYDEFLPHPGRRMGDQEFRQQPMPFLAGVIF
jgi:hypothetical protein